jgi:triosephosphate isomerase
VQLAILPSQDDAWSEWRREQRKMPALLSDRQPVVTEAERDGHPVWAIGTDGFADVAQASAFCDQVRAAGGSCSAEHP